MFRATLKSLLSRKLRLLLSGFAVVLGVMAVSASLVLTDTLSKSFDSLFETVNENTDVQITGKENVDVSEDQGEAITQPIPESVADQVRGIDGVAKATGSVSVDGARVVGHEGKVISSQGPPRLGINWDPDDELVQMRDGDPPSQPNQIAINASLADNGDFTIGEEVSVLTLEPAKKFTITGIFGFTGDRDTFGGETYVAFTDAVAQKLMLGNVGEFSDIKIKADPGVSDEELRDRVKAEIGEDYNVRTGEQVAQDNADDIQGFLDIIKYFLLAFAGIALFVGTFLILNTFSILVAQRTRELALLRSVGASRGQVIRSVLIEAVAVGLIASTIGFFAGLGIAYLLRKLFESLGDANLPGAALTIPPSAIIASYVVGVLVTVVAALAPALRASRVPPIAAMREAETPDRPLGRLTVLGSVPTALGVVLVAVSLFGGATIWALVLGVLLVFIGVAMLTPVISRPTISVLGRLVSFSVVGKLGRRNSSRNPRRTAITAAALMIGIALVTGVSVLADSLKASFKDLLQQDLRAELIIAPEGGFTGQIATFDPEVIDEAKQINGVSQAFALYADQAKVGDDVEFVAAGDVGGMADILSIKAKEGQIRDVEQGQFVVDEDYAKDHNLTIGEEVPVTTQRGGTQNMELVGIYEDNEVVSGSLLSTEDAISGFRFPQPSQGYIKLDSGANVDQIQREVDDLVKDSPEVTVLNQSELLDQVDEQINQFLVIVYVLLGLAIIIAVLGIINTLALSILERTRELGLLRAVGMRRGQVARMVTIESVVISVFGALLGVVVGAALGTAVVKALDDEGINVLSFPAGSLVTFFILAVIVGLLAAVIPAVRASRTNVLKAIAYE